MHHEIHKKKFVRELRCIIIFFFSLFVTYIKYKTEKIFLKYLYFLLMCALVNINYFFFSFFSSFSFNKQNFNIYFFFSFIFSGNNFQIHSSLLLHNFFFTIYDYYKKKKKISLFRFFTILISFR